MRRISLTDQILQIQRPDLLLLVECGYRYRAFDRDGEILAQICDLCFSGNEASFPVWRLHLHLCRLVKRGIKVGIVNQAGIVQKGKLVHRELQFVVTCLNYEVKFTESLDYLHCICALVVGKFAFFIVRPHDSAIVYSENLAELRNALNLFCPCEILSVEGEDISRESEREIEQYRWSFGAVRIEKLKDRNLDVGDCLQANIPLNCARLVDKTMHYFKELGLDNIFYESESYRRFEFVCNSMFYGQSTIENLCVFTKKESFDFKFCSLYRFLDRTRTLGGRRLLKQWIQKPLTCIATVNTRLDAVQWIANEIKSGDLLIKDLLFTLNSCTDIEKVCTKIITLDCSVNEFKCLISTLRIINAKLLPYVHSRYDLITSDMLKAQFNVIKDFFYDESFNISGIWNQILVFEETLNAEYQETQENQNTLHGLFKNNEDFPEVQVCLDKITKIENELAYHLDAASLALGAKLRFKHNQNMEFAIEIPMELNHLVSSNWKLFGRLKNCSFYKSPEIEKLCECLNEWRQLLFIANKESWKNFLKQFRSNISYSDVLVQIKHLMKCVNSIDVLQAFAFISLESGYSRPVLNNPEYKKFALKLIDFRHPLLENIKKGNFIRNSLHLESENTRTLIISGPNMGGKSTILKSVGLICIMAQIGCYVPAQCMEATLFDSVFCRSGASDKIFSGKSTFMVEMNEAYEIISKASSRSLVLIDELGRGTSTSDGYSIACSVIHRLTSVNQCACLFVTHFSSLCNEFERIFPVTAVNYHMSFDFKEFIPLFKLKPGICPSSFGIIVAKKAGIPESILKAAHVKSLERWIRFYLK